MHCFLIRQDDWISLNHFSMGLGLSATLWRPLQFRNNTLPLDLFTMAALSFNPPHQNVRSKPVSIEQ
jgi:hypothetical protein